MSDELNDLRKQVGCAGASLSLFVVLPAWLYLVHFLLQATNANEVVWFIYWAYVPLTIISSAMSVWGRGK